jgi:hypothetical protein
MSILFMFVFNGLLNALVDGQVNEKKVVLSITNEVMSNLKEERTLTANMDFVL